MTFKRSISCRIAEGFLSKEEANMSFPAFAELAAAAGYDAICMRASQIGVQTPRQEVQDARRVLDELGLGVSMVTGDFDIVYNNQRGPNCLQHIEPYLELARDLGAGMIRVCMKKEEDIPAARHTAKQAADFGVKVVHQCHIQSLFETLDEIVTRCHEVDHPNFGIIFEAANLEQCGQPYGNEAIQRLAPWLSNVYVQNQRIHSEGAITLETWCRGPIKFDVCEIPDDDGIDFRQIFQGLAAIGYDGFVTVHQSAPEDPNLTPQRAAQETADFLQNLS